MSVELYFLIGRLRLSASPDKKEAADWLESLSDRIDFLESEIFLKNLEDELRQEDR
jgi:hypothetical protein